MTKVRHHPTHPVPHHGHHTPHHPSHPTHHPTGHPGHSSFQPGHVGATGSPQGHGVTQYSALIQQSAAKYNLPPAFVAAVMDRETGGHNIIGDGGHGHGLMQIDNRSFGPWLSAHHNGLDPSTNIDKGCSILRENLDAAARHGLHGESAMKFAASAYNAGLGGAEAGLRSGNSDARTTGHNYGADVLNRMHRLAGNF